MRVDGGGCNRAPPGGGGQRAVDPPSLDVAAETAHPRTTSPALRSAWTAMRGTPRTLAQRISAAAALAAIGVVAAAAAAEEAAKTATAELCPRLLPGETIRFAGLYPAIEARLALANFTAGQGVEIDPPTMSLARGGQKLGGPPALRAPGSLYLIRRCRATGPRL